MKGVTYSSIGCGSIFEKYMKLLMALATISFIGCTGLRITNMTAPLIQDPREDMKFYCEFDMGDEGLYAVKWYKDDHEFFRYIPAGRPNLLHFHVMGVNVDLKQTNCAYGSCTLILTNLSTTYSSGAYRCEVSSEAPVFRLASQTYNVTIAVLPKENPEIHGLSGRYLIGDTVNATCTSGLGDPRPSIIWYIDQNPVDSKYIRELPTPRPSLLKEDTSLNLQKRKVQLRYPLDREVTKNKELASVEVACVQKVEELNQAIAKSQIVKKTILVSTEDHYVNNQKLYGFFGNGSTRDKNKLKYIGFLILFLMF